VRPVAGREETGDARQVLASLARRPLQTLSGAPNEIVEVRDRDVIVATGRSPAGPPVPIAMVQAALDQLLAAGELRIDVATVGHRSAFIGAVLQTLPGARAERHPQRIVLDGRPDPDARATELARRGHMWAELNPLAETVEATPARLKELGIYGG